MDLSVIIVNWNTRDMLARCLESVLGQKSVQPSADGRLLMEVWVVDNASTDGSAQLVRERFPEVHLIQNVENVGFARANNQAIRQSQGRHVLLLNSDTQVYPGAIQELVAFLDAHPDAGAAGARLLNADASLQPSCHPMLTPWREFWRLVFLDQWVHRARYSMKMWNATTPQRVEVIKGACLLLRQAALQQVGLLDDSFFMYTEEVDLCFRLAQAGWQLWWVPTATVVHYGEASSSQMPQAMYVQLYRSKVHFYRKYGGAPRAECFKLLLRLAYWPRLAIATAGAFFSKQLAVKAATYRRLLDELHAM